MNFKQFKLAVYWAMPAGTVLKNPGKGTSIIKSISTDNIRYQRRQSTISVALSDLFNAYKKYEGCRVSSSDLKKYAPSIYDSHARPAGHSCNCTFFFLVLEKIGIIKEVAGSGVRGKPYYVDMSTD